MREITARHGVHGSGNRFPGEDLSVVHVRPPKARFLGGMGESEASMGFSDLRSMDDWQCADDSSHYTVGTLTSAKTSFFPHTKG